MRILYDGWSLVYEPQGTAALHLLAMFSIEMPGIQRTAALPGKRPEWLPDEIESWVRETPDTALGRLKWEQGALPAIAEEVKAGWLHMLSPAAPLSWARRCIISQASYQEAPWRRGSRGSRGRRSLWDRIRESMAFGGVERARIVLWPDDLPEPDGLGQETRLVKLPPLVHPAFTPGRGQESTLDRDDLPDAYVLYQGAGEPEDLYPLLDAWSWAAGSIGEGVPLVVLGDATDARLKLDEELVDPELMKSVLVLSRPTSENPASSTAGIYKQAAAFFSAAELLPWGDPMRSAMRCGLPVAAAETKWTGAAVGPAAYLAPQGDARALGAALLTLIVEEEAAEKMGEAAAARAEEWQTKAFGERLLEVYREAG